MIGAAQLVGHAGPPTAVELLERSAQLSALGEAGLTAWQLEVLALLAQGLRNAEIAQRLVVSEKTVDHHVSAVLGKLGVRTRGEAGVEAIRRGLVVPSA
jgi:DNA-binding NarL/FixJ family response regulator